MKTNVYESAVMINAALDDEQIEVEVSRLTENIINFGGEIIEVDKVGRKRLAYVVNKSKIGYYAFFRFNAPSNIVAKLEIECLPKDIPQHLDVDVTDIKLGAAIHAGDLKFDKITILTPADSVVVTVTHPKVEKEPVVEELVEGAVEPEVVPKGKSEEDEEKGKEKGKEKEKEKK